ncbi:MAG: hydrogenase maturation nickel metallochaperone HypA [Sulfurovum sp.]|nr:MAG: hydrogenase maturation nickel metallochaperone HypA [Sulfurovum sp.]
MHEYSIVQALLNQCEEHVEENKATKVTKVVIKVGVLSGVEAQLLQTAFDTFKEATICDGAELIINVQKLKLECKECGDIYEEDEIRYFCQKCESLRVKVIDGEDMYLMSLEME